MRVARSFSSFEPRGLPGHQFRTALRTAHAANARAPVLRASITARFSLIPLIARGCDSSRLGPACYLKIMDGQIQSCGVRMVQNFIG